MSNFELWVGKLTPVDLDGKSNEEWLREFLAEPNLDFEDLVFKLEDEIHEEFFIHEDTRIIYRIDQFEHYINHRNPEEVTVEEVDPYNFFRNAMNPDGSFDFIASFYNGSRSLADMFGENLF